MQPTQTAIIVAIPGAEDAVSPFRTRLDKAASWGVPAHVTVLYSFLPPERINDEALTAVGEIVAAVPQFAVTLTHVEWFGDTVVWLAPQPTAPFRSLTAALWRRFPETPPYGGDHTDVIPHLTIGHEAPRQVLADAANTVAASLPIHAAITAVRLIAGQPRPNSWHTLATFQLGDRQPR